MNYSARATRKSAVMSMKMNPPSLVPPVRTKPYIDYDSLSKAEITKCNRLIDEFKRTGEIQCPSQVMYFKLVCVLREERRIASGKGDFKKAGEIDNLIRELSQFFHENNLYKAKAEEVSKAENQYNSTISRLIDVEDKWQLQMERLKAQSAHATHRVAETVNASMMNYDTKIPDALPPAFSKLSPELLDLKEKEKHMIGCRMFKEAAELHKEFEKRQKVELQRRREEYYRSFEINRNVLEKRNNRKLTAIQSDWDRKIRHAEHMMNKELNPLRDGCNFLERKLTAAKAEYIGEDDPIIKREKEVYSPQTYKVSPPMQTRGYVPRTMYQSTRTIEHPSEVTSTKKMSDTMMRQNRQLDSNRWPR
ncbi:hypothetical protein TRFO_12408 [Tritrichomonas foetus]|uniref:Uncharacterized protein n=1 Tax=Tritrichomonas foetus TaxID=1144522 RepID=A0A1J4L1Z7_9EUKA|nr:hypothetical protein TRFO_12408 [Tritrichomonas foetus]|eukprot:OHT17442.1 hypothetical protein TRFO_12408 [Tritrichomonas foetus]